MEEGLPWWLCVVKNLHAMQETWVQSLGWEDLLETEMVTHSSILASEIPWTEEPGRLYSPQGCKELETSEATLARTCRFTLPRLPPWS